MGRTQYQAPTLWLQPSWESSSLTGPQGRRRAEPLAEDGFTPHPDRTQLLQVCGHPRAEQQMSLLGGGGQEESGILGPISLVGDTVSGSPEWHRPSQMDLRTGWRVASVTLRPQV